MTPAAGDRAIDIRLKRGAVISGTVVDEFGDPVAGAGIGVESASAAGPGANPVPTTFTDDRGEYRAAGLGEGPVVVRVAVRGQEPVRLPNGDVVMRPTTQRIGCPVRTICPAATRVDRDRS